MPRQRRGSVASAPKRPTAAPARPNVTPPQQPNRPNTTAAAPPAQAQKPQAQGQSQGPGLFGQMASTAAGVAVGSSIGHAIGGFFGGGSSQAVEPADANGNNTLAQQDQQSMSRTCDGDAKTFTKCMDEHGGNMQICGWYLEQLKSCQAAASPY
ncbi:hypothetical protein MMC20_001483 [Loxospora ochrophaea]|nr:hypothetical protein [Loxospora ochrophaea]